MHTRIRTPTWVTSRQSDGKYVLKYASKTEHAGTPKQTCTSRQSPTKAANFTPTLLGPCLGTAVKHRQRDRWCRAGRRSFYCPSVRVTRARLHACLCAFVPRARAYLPCLRAFFKHHFVLHTHTHTHTPARVSGGFGLR